jgi:hypothetical protein
MPDYPREGVVVLYFLLFTTQVYLALLWALGKFRPLGVVWNTLTYGVLAFVFGLTALGTFQPPFINLVDQRWLLRASYTGYLVLSVFAIVTHWFSLVRQTMRRDAEDARRVAEDRMRHEEDARRVGEDIRATTKEATLHPPVKPPDGT